MQIELDVRKVVEAVRRGSLADVRTALGQCGSGDVLNTTNYAGANDVKGETALHVAVEFGDAEVIDYLLTHNARVDVRTAVEKKTPLHIAALLGNVAVADQLLRFNADLFLAASNGFTALHYAAMGGHAPMVAYLLEMGADPTAKSKARRSPADVALHYGHTEVAQHLQAASMKATGSVPTKPSSPTSPLGSSFGFSHAGYDDEVEEVYGPKKPVYGQHDISNVAIEEGDLREQFRQLDPGGRGYVTKAAFVAASQTLFAYGPPDPPARVAELLLPFGAAGPDRLTFDEFCVVMLRLAAR